MLYSIAGRTYITNGIVVNSENRLQQYFDAMQSKVFTLAKKETQFFLNEDNILSIKIGGEECPLSHSSLTDISKMLKLPASFVNKSNSDDLAVKIINESPQKRDGQWQVIQYFDTEHKQPFIAGFREGSFISSLEFVEMIKSGGVINRNNLQIEQLTHSVKHTNVYLLSKNIFDYKKDFHFDYRIGIAMQFSESSDSGFSCLPFYEIRVKNSLGEILTFDFVSNKPLLKINGKVNVFASELQKFLGEFDIGEISSDFSNIVQLLRAAISADQISYFLLKKARSAARRPFKKVLLGDSFKEIDGEIIPEYGEFRVDRKEEIKELPPFMANNLRTNFYFPLYFHRLYNFPATVEYPEAFFKSKQSVFSIMSQLAESVNIGNIS